MLAGAKRFALSSARLYRIESLSELFRRCHPLCERGPRAVLVCAPYRTRRAVCATKVNIVSFSSSPHAFVPGRTLAPFAMPGFWPAYAYSSVAIQWHAD